MKYFLIREDKELYQGELSGQKVMDTMKKMVRVQESFLVRCESRRDSLIYSERRHATGTTRWRLEFDSVLSAEMFYREFVQRKFNR